MPAILSVMEKQGPTFAILTKTLKVLQGFLPYSILFRLIYVSIKKLLKRWGVPYASIFAKGIVLRLVRRDYVGYFVILFTLEYVFKRYIYDIRQNRDDPFIKGALCMLSMGIFAVAMVEGKQRAIRPLNAISGYDINDMSAYFRGGKHFRPEGVNPFLWHLKLYINATKNAIVPLGLAVWVPTFFSHLLTGASVESNLYKSSMYGSFAAIKNSDDQEVGRAFKKATHKTLLYAGYVIIGLSQYPQVVDLFHYFYGHPPGRMIVFFIGMWGGIQWPLIPGDKIHAYNHWALTTMIDAILQV